MTNQERSEITREQLGRIEHALESLRRTVLPVNPARFELMAEGYIDMIAELRAELARLASEGSAVVDMRSLPAFDSAKSSPAN
jgi:hypothetical protein